MFGWCFIFFIAFDEEPGWLSRRVVDDRIVGGKRKFEEGDELVKAIILQRLHFGLSEEGLDANVEICKDLVNLLKAHLTPSTTSCDSVIQRSFDVVHMVLEQAKSKYQRRQWIERHFLPVVRSTYSCKC